MTVFEAVASADLPTLEAALARTADVNALGEGRRTALIDAAAAGWREGVERLIKAGAETEWRDESNETALLKAAANGHVEVARVLAPFASDDDRDLARAFLKAFSTSNDAAFQFDERGFGRQAVELAARAAKFVGHDEPLERLERVDRAEQAARAGLKKKW